MNWHSLRYSSPLPPSPPSPSSSPSSFLLLSSSLTNTKRIVAFDIPSKNLQNKFFEFRYDFLLSSVPSTHPFLVSSSCGGEERGERRERGEESGERGERREERRERGDERDARDEQAQKLIITSSPHSA